MRLCLDESRKNVSPIISEIEVVNYKHPFLENVLEMPLTLFKRQYTLPWKKKN